MMLFYAAVVCGLFTRTRLWQVNLMHFPFYQTPQIKCTPPVTNEREGKKHLVLNK